MSQKTDTHSQTPLCAKIIDTPAKISRCIFFRSMHDDSYVMISVLSVSSRTDLPGLTCVFHVSHAPPFGHGWKRLQMSSIPRKDKMTQMETKSEVLLLVTLTFMLL